jgi:hypothetical protein
MRKGIASMWWIIVGAVIALVVMIVLIVLFTGKTKIVERGLLECESKGGSCDYVDANYCREEGGTPSTQFSCPDKDVPCCFGAG